MSRSEDQILEEIRGRLDGDGNTDPALAWALGEETLEREYRELVGLVPYALEPVEPQPATRASLLGKLDAPAPVEPETARVEDAVPSPLPFTTPAPSMPLSYRLSQAVAAALGVAVLGLGVFSFWLYSEHRAHTGEILAIRSEMQASLARENLLRTAQQESVQLKNLVTASRTRVCHLRPYGDDPVQPVARGMVYFDTEGREYFLAVKNLAPCTDGYAYRLWFLVDDKPVLGTSFNVSAGTPVGLGSRGMPEGTSAIMVTYQTVDGKEPAGEQILYGDESEEML